MSFTPGQWNVLCIIKWQLSANLNKNIFEDLWWQKTPSLFRNASQKFCVLRVGCVGLYQLTQPRTHGKILSTVYASSDFRYRWYQNYTLGIFLLISRNSNTTVVGGTFSQFCCIAGEQKCGCEIILILVQVIWSDDKFFFDWLTTI